MGWQWKQGKAHLLAPCQHIHQLELKAGYNTDQPIPVPQLSPYAAYRTLGAYISPSGSMYESFWVLSSKALDYATQIHYGPISYISYRK